MDTKKITVDKIVEICGGVVLSRGTASTIESFCVDTRVIKENDLFISLKSECADASKYVEDALKKGAIGCITEYEIPKHVVDMYNNKLIIKVNDTIKAIQEIARYKRSLYNIPVIAITGSVGKTSTKDMIANVLAQKYNVSKTQGNYNNHIGVPITILNWSDNTTAAVVEMGMNHFGEIEVLTQITKPTMAVITNIGTAHIGILGSRENILKAKLEILDGLEKNGKIIINNDDDMLNKFETNKYSKITYGINNKSAYSAENIVENEASSNYSIIINNKKIAINVPIAGKHFIYNSLCAIAVGSELGISEEKIKNGINTFELSSKRNEIKKINNLIIINDYYNASYDSMRAGLEVLSKINEKRKIAVLGDMLELGDFAEELHKRVGQEVANNHIDILFTVGELAGIIAKEAQKLGIKEVYECKTNEECIKQIIKIIQKQDCILLKASNRMNFGEISNSLQEGKIWENSN